MIVALNMFSTLLYNYIFDNFLLYTIILHCSIIWNTRVETENIDLQSLISWKKNQIIIIYTISLHSIIWNASRNEKHWFAIEQMVLAK